MKTKRMKPIHFYIPITRVDEAERIVEGYAFVNERVDGEGGICLKRSAMEAATPDYLRWGAVREMHQPIAAGTATAPGCGIEWDENGAFLRAKIVDESAWNKVKEGVYKGFSVGVLPRLMRGKDVEQCVWAENSLVDRPKDTGAVFTTFRAEGVDLDAEVDVEVEDEEPIERAADPASFRDLVASHEPDTLRSLAFDLLRYSLMRLQRSNLADKDAKARESIQQFADYITPIIAGPPAEAETPCDCYYAEQATLTRLLENTELTGPLRDALEEIQRSLPVPAAPAEAPDLTRFETLETEHGELTQRVATLTTETESLTRRAETAETELATVKRSLSTAEERVRTLEAMPAPANPVRFPQALSREFLANQQQSQDAGVAALRTELQRLMTELPQEPDEGKKREGVIRLNVVRQELAARGERG